MHRFLGTQVFLGDFADAFPAWLAGQNFSKILVVADANTRRFCLPIFEEKSRLRDLPVVEIPAGEQHKTLATAEQVWAKFMAEKLDRRSLVVCLGGGVVGDLGGFCAATFKRGVAFVQIPTSLLAMTDAALGGKLGVDFQGVKNMVGVFQEPAAVFADPDFLVSLPERELRSGFAEVVKHARIGDPVLWKKIQKMDSLAGADWTSILKKSMAVKLRVVRRDPLENGLRRLLNFGHTYGHALESFFLETASPLTHGEAVAEGMIWEMRLANPLAASELEVMLRRFFPKPNLPDGAAPRLWQLMQHDKKNAAGNVRCALPADGKLGIWDWEIEEADVLQAMPAR